VRPIGVGIIGFGKIAADSHVPAIEGNERFKLLATSSRSGQGMARTFTDWRDLIRDTAGLEAVAITTPPGPRLEIARVCAEAGLHVLLEKPPAATITEAEALQTINPAVTMFATWHARHNPAVPAAADLLAGKRITALRITWHEDVRKWHPGQDWIWDPGGFGVFDPGINALSIATAILSQPLFVKAAELLVPENAATPIAADIEFGPGQSANFDWRRSEGEEWTVEVATDDKMCVRLERGGAELFVNGERQACDGMGEYPSIYAQFLDLIDSRRSDIDLAPLRLVADCMLVGRQSRSAPVDRA
jgi:predicted dehydrogenase